MFICKKCKRVDKFELMFSPDYQGEMKIERTVDSKGNIKITADGYTFVPDLTFMNNHAVCGYCGSIYSWDYSN